MSLSLNLYYNYWHHFEKRDETMIKNKYESLYVVIEHKNGLGKEPLGLQNHQNNFGNNSLC